MLALFNQMYLDGRILEKQKHGVVMRITNSDNPTTPEDYRPIILLNKAYKILARIVANRLRSTFSEMLHPSQYCGLPGNTIFDAVATVWDGIAYVELTIHPFLGFHGSFWQDLALLSISDAKTLWLNQEIHHTHTSSVWGGSVVVKALRYKSVGPGIDSRRWRLEFLWQLTFPCVLGSTQPLKMSTRIFLGVKAAGV